MGMIENVKDVLDKIDIIIEAKGWDRKTLAKLTGRSEAWLSRIMNQNRKLTVEALLEIAKALDVDPSSLLSDEVRKKTIGDYLREIFREEAKSIIREELEKHKPK